MCHAHARPCLSTGWALKRRFGLTSGTAAVLAQRGGGTQVCTARTPWQEHPHSGVTSPEEGIGVTGADPYGKCCCIASATGLSCSPATTCKGHALGPDSILGEALRTGVERAYQKGQSQSEGQRTQRWGRGVLLPHDVLRPMRQQCHLAMWQDAASRIPRRLGMGRSA